MQKTTLFNYYMIARQYCFDMAKQFLEDNETKLSKFYFNAANGFAKKANSLSIGEANLPIWY